MYFKRGYNRVAHFASKNQLTGLSVSGTLVENGLMIQMIKKMVLWNLLTGIILLDPQKTFDTINTKFCYKNLKQSNSVWTNLKSILFASKPRTRIYVN